MADLTSVEVMWPRWQQAVEQVDRWLSQYAGTARLGNEAAQLYPKRAAKDGWRVPVAFSGGTRQLDILVGAQFPFVLPRFVLVDRPTHRSWPHLESDGSLCLLPNNTLVSYDDPVALIKKLMLQAVDLIEAAESGANIDDFRAEFTTYWPLDSTAPLLRSLLAPHARSRVIAVHRSRGLYTVADDDATLIRWHDHATTSSSDITKAIDPALLVWLDEPPLPSEYPRSSFDIAEYVRKAGLGTDLESITSKKTTPLVVIFGAKTATGTAFVGSVLSQPSNLKSRRPSHGGIERGFRPGKAPPDLLSRRFLGAARPALTLVQRIDAAWIHGRELDPAFPSLQSANVVLVGCGSIGGPTAIALAQAGVGSLTLIDPDLLSAANVGRHPLGIPHVDFHKSIRLARRVREDYPHIIYCKGIAKPWEDVLAHTPDVLADADLIISTTGEWASEAALNAWRQDHQGAPDLLFGWTEAHAVAGHAVGLMKGEGCLACGFTAWGEPMLPVAAWPHGTGLGAEPGCGAVFQPYGPIEVSHVTAMIAEAAIDMLMGRADVPFHRTWVARQPVLDRVQAAWSNQWLTAHHGRPQSGRIEERAWRPQSSCRHCGASA